MKEVIDAIVALFKGGVGSLQKKSAKTLNVFKETVVKLEKINEKIETERTARAEKIKALAVEAADLKTQHDDNQKVITKINEFFDGTL